MANVSIFVQTLNEEANLPGLLETVRWSDDIVILDSLSSDRTKEIALSRGCRWFERAFDGRGAHQTWAMRNIAFKYPWVFYLDADERMTPELKNEIVAIAGQSQEARVAFYCGRKNYFMGRWIRHAFPPWDVMRFFRPEYVAFSRLANPSPEIKGKYGYLKHMFLHYSFSKGLGEWVERHNRYSTYEALETIKAMNARPVAWRSLCSCDKRRRRDELKNLSMRLPCRPLLKFLYLFVVSRGFLDGAPGLTYCLLQMIYEYLTVLKVREMRLREKGEMF